MHDFIVSGLSANVCSIRLTGRSVHCHKWYHQLYYTVKLWCEWITFCKIFLELNTRLHIKNLDLCIFYHKEIQPIFGTFCTELLHLSTYSGLDRLLLCPTWPSTNSQVDQILLHWGFRHTVDHGSSSSNYYFINIIIYQNAPDNSPEKSLQFAKCSKQ